MTTLFRAKISVLTLGLLCLTQLASASDRRDEYQALSLAVIQESAVPLRKLHSHGFDLTTHKQRKEAAHFVIGAMINLLETKCPTAEDFTQARSMQNLSDKIFDENKIDKTSSLDTSEIYGRLSRRVQKDILEMDAKKALCDIDLSLNRLKR